MFRSVLVALCLVSAGGLAIAQRPQAGGAVQQFVKVNAPVVAITHVRVIDGTGAPAKDDHTVILRDGNIAAVGTRCRGPRDATVIDATGKSLIPGLVMLHEHTYYPTGPNVYGQLGRALRGCTSPAV